MTLADYRKTYAWQSALELGPHLVRVAEQLPDDETPGLGAELRRLSVDIPAAVAAQLVTGDALALVVVLRGVAALEVIERVYPALDTAAARAACDELAVRVDGKITELVPAAEPEPASDDDADAPAGPAAAPASHPAAAAADTPLLVTPAPETAQNDAHAAAAEPAPSLVHIAADLPATTVPVNPSAPTTIPVTGDHVVHPNSQE